MSAVQFLIVLVPVGIPLRFFSKILLHRFRQVDAGLVGDADQYEQHVSELVRQFLSFIRWFPGLLSIGPGHDSGHFTDFFHQDGHVGQFIEVSDTVGSDPVVYKRLKFFQLHWIKIIIRAITMMSAAILSLRCQNRSATS